MSRVRVRGWWLLPMVAGAIALIPWPGLVIDAWYSRGLFPPLQRGVTSLTNLTSVAVIDVGLVLVSLWLVLVCVRLIRAGRTRGWLSGVWEGSRRIVRVAGGLVLIFLVAWGLNYRRTSLEQVLGGRPGDPLTSEAVVALAEGAARAATAARDAPGGAGTGYADIATRLEPAFQEALRRLGLPPLSVVGRPKHSRLLTPFFTAAGVTGMVNPVALESIVHPDLLPFERPMVLAHEWAHLAGVADEADASAVAWLACVLGDPSLVYSAELSVVLETASVIPRAEWQRIRSALSPGVIEDITALAARLARQQPVVRETAFKVYDGYLKSNRVEDGVRSYSRVIRVLLTPGMQRAYGRSSLSRSSGVIGVDDIPVRRSSGSASGPSVSGR